MNLAHRWDIFCSVIDNYGDIGVCWRLAADLASRGAQVRLWVDDASALGWMAPDAAQGRWPGVRVLAWDQASDPSLLATLAPADVWIEAFGCDIPPTFLTVGLNAARQALRAPPVWINLEYLTAERFAERAHGLPSPVMQGVAQGQTKYFYYPGFTPRSGGLLREPELASRQARFDRAHWLAQRGIPWQGEQLVSLFCYEPTALPAVLAQWQHSSRPTRLLVTPGRATAAVRAAMRDQVPGGLDGGRLRITELPALTQVDFDHLLWACDLNLVRGEDSVIRALWAGKPLLWQIYPQHDDAHHAKLQAFLDTLAAPPSLRQAHQCWNSIGSAPTPVLAEVLPGWETWATFTRDHQRQQHDLTTRLLEFVAARQPEVRERSEKR
jgi:uncharacterized repeat protein (TIGR03837 family)